MPNFSKIFFPQSVAVVGASTKQGRVGNDILKNLIRAGFGGKIYPINPRAKELLGLKCYPNLKAVKGKIDLMIIAVPAKIVLEVLKQGGDLGVPGAIIISSGFKEVGEVILEEKIKDVCRQKNITLIGPNCLGLINPVAKLNASFAAATPLAGKIAFISQSGALCTAMIDLAESLNLGFSKFISIGNKAMIEEIALLNYLANDKETEIIALYTEQLSNSFDFLQVARRLAQKNKPLIILKGGRSEAGAGASASHTGALAGNNQAYLALFKQANVIVVDKISELFNYLQILTYNKFKPFKKLAILSNAGGPAVLAVDSLKNNDLSLASFGADSFKKLAENLPFNASLGNPIDILGDAGADRYQLGLAVLAKDKNVEAVLTIFSPQSMSEAMATAKAIVNFKKTNQALAAVFMGEKLSKASLNYLRQKGVAAFSFPEEAIKALSVFSTWLKQRASVEINFKRFNNVQTRLVKNLINQAKEAERSSLREDQAFKVLTAYKIATVKNVFVNDFKQAIKKSQAFKDNLVLKIVSPDILHKSEVGGVKLDIIKAEIRPVYNNLLKQVKAQRPAAAVEGVLITEMIKQDRVEMIIGAVKDPTLGPVVMVGFGGIYVEIIQDKAFGVHPLSLAGAKKMINSLQMLEILEGARGKAVFDKEAVAQTLLKVMQLMHDFPELQAIDINPLVVFKKGQGVMALDARILID